MKRIKFIYVILLMVMGGMIAASCNKEKETDVANNVDTIQDTIIDIPHDTIIDAPQDTLIDSPQDTTIIYDATDWVDLGLPSGLLWATRNVGASTPTDYGDYFAWGETEPKSEYNWETNRYYNDDYRYYNNAYGWTKYNGTDGLTTLQAGDDAATAHYGGRTPTKDEWVELYENTTSKGTSIEGVYGRCFTGSNGNSLFLPAAGTRYDSVLGSAGLYGYYWSASRGGQNGAWFFLFGDDGVDWIWNDYYRSGGLSVRAVRSAR